MKALKTKNLKFLDITNYIAPGYSYDAFVKAYDCHLTKGYFPFEYITSLDKLNDQQLPPHHSFYSTLKQSNITSEQYQYCRDVWEHNGMKSMRDFLIWYNNLDVQPFLEAIEKQFSVYKSKGLDMFKQAVSVPSLATKWLFKESNTKEFSIPLIPKNHSDLYGTIRNNIVGGPAIIFHRYHEKDITSIKSNKYGDKAKLCKNVYGLDANALYLYACMQNLPTGSIIRRKKCDNFRPIFADYHGRQAHEWLEFISYCQNISIEHKYNTGEIRLGQHSLPVDGFCKENSTVYQFHGCLFHGCVYNDCPIVSGQQKNPVNGKYFHELYTDTKDKENYFRQLGYQVVTIFECEWSRVKSKSPGIKQFIDELSYREMSERKAMTEKSIIDAVKGKRFFGFVEVDIQVPSSLRSEYSEFPPIFKNASISRNDLSPLMFQFAIDNNLYNQPQKSLIGSMFANKILLTTDLLQWYMLPSDGKKRYQLIISGREQTLHDM